jgi:hypothetical protein
MDWRLIVKRALPPALLNRVLLMFPWLYRTRVIRYETTLYAHHGIDDLVSQLTLALDLDGDIVECGSSRGGASLIMAEAAKKARARKTIYAFDSFEGFDRAELAKETAAGLARVSERAFTSTSYQYVTRKIQRLGYAGTIVPVKGYFQHTLPNLHSTWCFALIDCDLRDSLSFCAETIWPQLIGGGRIVFDDYADDQFRGARLGIDEFVHRHPAEIAAHGLLQRLYFVSKA